VTRFMQILLFLVVAVLAAVAFASATTHEPGAVDPCLIYGPIITLLVALLKRIPWVAQYPKVVAAILSSLLAVGGTFFQLGDVSQLVQCTLSTFALSVATYEVALKPLVGRTS
jgi:hypothetical protein